MRFTFILVLATLGMMRPTPSMGSESDPDKRGEARRHLEAGKAMMKVDDFARAIEAFDQSVRAYPTKNALFNLANCYKAVREIFKSK
ncbi:MAG: hypothetical protein GY847_14880 [Proteobacteria bacterium]|nr:hypothetical protein [Pseudomonadota bacterium]